MVDDISCNSCVCICVCVYVHTYMSVHVHVSVCGVGVAMAESGPTAAKRFNNGGKKVVMVTGGSGLVGQALREQAEMEANPNEEWVFLSSRDGDLW